MPHRSKKQFIDKKKSVTFQLVHRSQKDPLLADEDAPQRILVPMDGRLEPNLSETPKQHEERLSKQKIFGVGFEDDYDYLQHLKEPEKDERAILVPKESSGIEAIERAAGEAVVIRGGEEVMRLPAVVFESRQEEEIGMLHRALPPVGPQPTWDPDVVAGMDEDFNFSDPENQLEDDFIALACDKNVNYNHENEEFSDGEYSDMDSDSQFSDESFSEEETKSRFTAYSMTSSVMRRNEQLTFLDDKFEKIFEEYDEEKIGDISHVEIEGGLPVEDLDHWRGMKMLLGIREEELDEMEEKEKPKIQYQALNLNGEEDGEDGVKMVKMVQEKPDKQWDCESILSTYSTLYNHPKIIKDPPKKIKVSQKTGIPLDTLGKPKLTKKQLHLLDDEPKEPKPVIRKGDRKNETKEEKASRKQQVKEARRERRQEKKATKIAFSQEKCRQRKELVNLRQNLSGIVLS